MGISNEIEKLCDSDLLNLTQIWNTSYPELSSCFHQTLLVWCPSIFLWIFLPYQIYYLMAKSDKIIKWNAYNVMRQLIACLLAIVMFIDLLTCLLREFVFEDSPVSSELLASVIKFATKLFLCFLFYFHKIRGVHTSGIIWIYLLVQALFDTLSLYSYSTYLHRQPLEYYYFVIEYALNLCLFFICCFSDKLDLNNYTNIFDDPKKKICSKELASFPSKLTFWWFNDLAIRGWKKPLTANDLWDVRMRDKSDHIFKEFNKNLKLKAFQNPYDSFVFQLENGDSPLQDKKGKFSKIQEQKRYSLFMAIIKTFWSYFLPPVILRFFSDLLQLGNPLILKMLIAYTADLSEPSWHGYVYAGLFIVSNLTQSLVNAYHSHRMYVLGLRIRTSVISSIYRKSLGLSNSAKKDSTTGEIINLMAVDASRFLELFQFINYLSAPVQIAITLWLLYYELGISVFAGVGVMVILIPINSYIASIVKKYQTKQMKLKDKRLKIMNEILSGVKVIKLYSWEEAFMKTILSIREEEILFLRKSGYISCVLVVLGSATPLIVSVCTFGTYVFIDSSHVLDAQKAFVSIALFNLLRLPLYMLPNLINNMILASISIKRITKFLNLNDLTDYISHNDEKEMIIVKDASFSWDSPKEIELGASPTLKKINLRIKKGKFVAIVGTVGSGKSSLLNAILGELEKLSGYVNITKDTKIAYVPQQAWIQNATVKQNILFGKEFNHLSYKNIIRGCALRQDLDMLSGGDQTEIGEKGINLSGGQKQRISLARACYSDGDLYILDDPLSAVDSHVGKHIFDNVLSSKTGLLKDKTRILATNSLFVLPEVDLIIVLKNGEISEVGAYNELLDKKGDFAEIIEQFSTNKSQNEEKEQDLEKSLRNRASTVEIPLSKEQQEESKLIEDEKVFEGNIKLDVYKKYINAITPLIAIGVLVSYIFVNVCISGSNFWLAYWTENEKSKESTYFYLGIYTLICFSEAIFVTFGWSLVVKGCLLASKVLHKRLLYKTLRAPMSFFDTTPLGRIMNRFSKDIDVLDNILPPTTRVLISTSIQTITTIIVISSQTPLFLTIVGPVIIFYYFIQKFYVVISRQLRRLESISKSPIYNHFGETLNGVSTIRAYNVRQRFINESNDRVDQNQACFYPSQAAYCWLQIRLEFLSNCMIFFAALFAVLGRESLNSSVVGLSVSYSLTLTLVLNWCVRMFADFETNIVAVERIDEYCNIKSEAEWKSDKPPSITWPEKGLVQFKQYSTRYRPTLDLVLKEINFQVKEGEKIGIVGRTGAGKSSLTLAVFRLIEATNGTIVIDDIDISKIGLHELRSKITIIPQDPVLFSGTIRTNLDPFNVYSSEKIWQALEHAHLKDFVTSLESGLEYVVSEGGDNLSVGQRQLMCLARALLRRTKLLILDEATAAVDPETDALIQNTIRQEFAHCTVLTIAHRLHTIMDSNRVLVLDNGKVAEFDSPNQLLRNKSTIFYSLAENAGLV